MSPDERRPEHEVEDEQDSDSDSEYTPPSPSLLAKYDTLVSSKLDISTLPSASASAAASAAAAAVAATPPPDEDLEGRPMTAAEKQNAKKRRRKERERLLRAEADALRVEPVVTPTEQPIPFKLFSEVRPVSLSTTETYSLPPNPRLIPLKDDERKRISRLAAESALEAPLLPGRPPRQVEEYVLLPAPRRKTPMGNEVFPPAFSGCAKSVYVPVLRLGVPLEEERRKRRRKAPREFPLPGFWRPEEGVGGKSAGYAYGWRHRW